MHLLMWRSTPRSCISERGDTIAIPARLYCERRHIKLAIYPSQIAQITDLETDTDGDTFFVITILDEDLIDFMNGDKLELFLKK